MFARFLVTRVTTVTTERCLSVPGLTTVTTIPKTSTSKNRPRDPQNQPRDHQNRARCGRCSGLVVSDRKLVDSRPLWAVGWGLVPQLFRCPCRNVKIVESRCISVTLDEYQWISSGRPACLRRCWRNMENCRFDLCVDVVDPAGFPEQSGLSGFPALSCC